MTKKPLIPSATCDLRGREGFETVEEAERRRARNILILEAGDERECRKLAARLRRCKRGERCGSWACDVCKRRGRIGYVAAGSEAFGDTATLAATIVLAGQSLPAGELREADISKLKDLCRKRIERAGLGDRLIIGPFEWSANSDGAAPTLTSWQPQLHLAMAADPSKDPKEDAKQVAQRLKAVFPKADGVPRPVKVVPIYDLPGWLSYAAKPFYGARVGYRGENGRRQTKKQRLKPELQREALIHSNQIPLRDRLFLRKVRRAGERFVTRDAGDEQ